jgi:hypothetical protein
MLVVATDGTDFTDAEIGQRNVRQGNGDAGKEESTGSCSRTAWGSRAILALRVIKKMLLAQLTAINRN